MLGIAERLAALGHEVAEADPRYGPIGLTFVPRSTAGVREWAERVPRARLLDPRTRVNARNGLLLGGGVQRLARAAEDPLRRRVGEIFRRFDVVLTPTTAMPPLRIGALSGLGSWRTDEAMITACPYNWPWNVLGWPGVSVPAGFVRAEGAEEGEEGEEGEELPVGAQLLGPADSEPLLISLAAQLEADQRWYERWPPGCGG